MNLGSRFKDIKQDPAFAEIWKFLAKVELAMAKISRYAFFLSDFSALLRDLMDQNKDSLLKILAALNKPSMSFK